MDLRVTQIKLFIFSPAKNEKFSDQKPLFASFGKLLKLFFPCVCMHIFANPHFSCTSNELMMINGRKGNVCWSAEDYNVAFCATSMFDDNLLPINQMLGIVFCALYAYMETNVDVRFLSSVEHLVRWCFRG